MANLPVLIFYFGGDSNEKLEVLQLCHTPYRTIKTSKVEHDYAQ